MLWERRNKGKTLPPLATTLSPLPPGSPDDVRRVSQDGTTAEALTTSYFPSEKPVEELLRELYELQKLNNDLPNDEELKEKQR